MDRQSDLLLAALKEASWYPDGIPLYRVGKNPGIFATKSGSAQQAARQALEAGYLELINKDGKADIARLTPRGEVHLREHQDPKVSLEELLERLRATQQGLPLWIADIEAQFAALRMRMQTSLEQHGEQLSRLIGRADSALRRLQASSQVQVRGGALDPWQVETLMILDRSTDSGAGISLPTLFGELQKSGFSELVMPDFHSGLLLLRDRGSVLLLPASGPLEDLEEPEYALVDEGNILYFAKRS